MGGKTDRLPIGARIRNFKIIKMLGEGSFGSVYQVLDVNTNINHAMKTEPLNEEDSMIKMEVAVLKSFRNSQEPHSHVLKYIDSGTTSRWRYVVMQLAGPNLSDVRKGCAGNHFSASTTARLGIQCVRSIEELHKIGFLHRDIKPPNYAIGVKPHDRIVFLLDFGLARQYLDRNGKMRSPRNTVGFRGTVRYASINAHLRRDLGRHDDLWSLMYMLVELQRGKLPWRKISGKDAVLEMKKNTVADKLVGDMGEEYHRMVNELQGLQFQDKPNYDWFCEQLESIMKRKGYRHDSPYDWEQGSSVFESFRKAALSKHPYKWLKKGEKPAKEAGGDERSQLSEK